LSEFSLQIDAKKIAAALHLSLEQVNHIVADIIRKQHATEYLRTSPLEVDT